MAMVLRIDKFTTSSLYKSNIKKIAEDLAKEGLNEKNVEKLVELSGLPVLEETLKNFGYRMDKMLRKDSYILLLAKSEKEKSIEDVQKDFIKIDYSIQEKLGNNNYKMTMCACCENPKDGNGLLDLLINW